MSISSSLSLRNVLRLDAATCVASGLASIAGASFLSDLFGLPESLLRAAGVFLLGFALLTAFAAAKLPTLRWPSWFVIVGNGVWVLQSVLLLLSDSLSPTLLGTGYVIAQAIVVAVLAELEFSRLRALALVSDATVR